MYSAMSVAGRDRVAGEDPAAGGDGALGERVRAGLEQAAALGCAPRPLRPGRDQGLADLERRAWASGRTSICFALPRHLPWPPPWARRRCRSRGRSGSRACSRRSSPRGRRTSGTSRACSAPCARRRRRSGQTCRQKPHALHMSSPTTTSHRPAGPLGGLLLSLEQRHPRLPGRPRFSTISRAWTMWARASPLRRLRVVGGDGLEDAPVLPVRGPPAAARCGAASGWNWRIHSRTTGMSRWRRRLPAARKISSWKRTWAREPLVRVLPLEAAGHPIEGALGRASGPRRGAWPPAARPGRPASRATRRARPPRRGRGGPPARRPRGGGPPAPPAGAARAPPGSASG